MEHLPAAFGHLYFDLRTLRALARKNRSTIPPAYKLERRFFPFSTLHTFPLFCIILVWRFSLDGGYRRLSATTFDFREAYVVRHSGLIIPQARRQRRRVRRWIEQERKRTLYSPRPVRQTNTQHRLFALFVLFYHQLLCISHCPRTTRSSSAPEFHVDGWGRLRLARVGTGV